MVRPRARGAARARQRAESLIPYRKLTVPCCIECNTEFLSNIETAVRPLFRRGDVVHREERFALARWLSKILIGVHLKETSLLFDRSQPHRGPIIDPGVIDHLRQCHFVLQSARKRASFVCLHGDFPFTFYSYNVREYRKRRKFDLSTNIAGQSIAIRVGRLGAIFVNDGGFQMHVGSKGPFELAGAELSESSSGKLQHGCTTRRL